MPPPQPACPRDHKTVGVFLDALEDRRETLATADTQADQGVPASSPLQLP